MNLAQMQTILSHKDAVFRHRKEGWSEQEKKEPGRRAESTTLRALRRAGSEGSHLARVCFSRPLFSLVFI